MWFIIRLISFVVFVVDIETGIDIVLQVLLVPHLEANERM
jgi:hypothetical protein